MLRRGVLRALLFCCWISALSARHCEAQQTNEDGSISIVFHVTSIKKDVPDNYCTTGKCSATRFTVQGYARVTGDIHTTGYLLSCVEFIQLGLDNKNPNLYCPRLRANGSFDAKLYADSIFFGAQDASGNIAESKGMTSGFDILSEQEITNPKP